MTDFWLAILNTITGGVILTLLLFILNEYIFRKKNFTGEWLAELKVISTSYSKYNGMRLYYKIHLLQKGYELEGTGEKFKEILLDNSTTAYPTPPTVKISGYYERKFLSKSKVYLSIIEKGAKRESRTIFQLNSLNKKKLKGKFSSTAANKRGEAFLNKKEL